MARLIPIVIGHKGYWGSKLFKKVQDSPHYITPIGFDTKDYNNGSQPWTIPSDVAIVATPTLSHYSNTLECLKTFKNVLIEKPATQTSAGIQHLVNVAKENDLKLGVDHTFLFDEHIRVLRNTIFENNTLGFPYTIRIERHNLGKFQDGGVIWDLVPHDLAVLDYLFLGENGSLPEIKTVTVQTTDDGLAHTADILLIYKNPWQLAPDVPVYISLSWLYPKKVRTTTIVCENGMATYDMLSPTPLVITDKKAWPQDTEWHHNYMWDKVYRGPVIEPLQRLVDEFALWVKGDLDNFISPGTQGERVVRTIESIIEKQETINGSSI